MDRTGLIPRNYNASICEECYQHITSENPPKRKSYTVGMVVCLRCWQQIDSSTRFGITGEVAIDDVNAPFRHFIPPHSKPQTGERYAFVIANTSLQSRAANEEYAATWAAAENARKEKDNVGNEDADMAVEEHNDREDSAVADVVMQMMTHGVIRKRFEVPRDSWLEYDNDEAMRLEKEKEMGPEEVITDEQRAEMLGLVELPDAVGIQEKPQGEAPKYIFDTLFELPNQPGVQAQDNSTTNFFSSSFERPEQSGDQKPGQSQGSSEDFYSASYMKPKDGVLF